jgi:hypothetical protein
MPSVHAAAVQTCWASHDMLGGSEFGAQLRLTQAIAIARASPQYAL